MKQYPTMQRIGNHVVLTPDWNAVIKTDTVARLARAWTATIDATKHMHTLNDRVSADRDLTPAGQKNKLRAAFTGDVAKTLKEARDAIQAAEVEAGRIRTEAEAGAKPDKTDVAGALLRAEVRTWLRGLDASKRAVMIVMPERVDPMIAAAIVEAPPELTGFTAEQRAKLAEPALATHAPEAARELAAIAEASEAVLRVMDMLAEDGRDLTGLAEHEVAELAGAPTLRQKITAQLEADGLAG